MCRQNVNNKRGEMMFKKFVKLLNKLDNDTVLAIAIIIIVINVLLFIARIFLI